MLDIENIQKILPQRYPLLMLDRVIELDPGKKVVALKNVSINEGFFAGHFPGKPVMPGALIIEAMVQAAILLSYSPQESAQDKKLSYYLTAVKIRFLNPVFPGDQLKITVTPVKLITDSGIANAVVESGSKEIAKGEISFGIKRE